MKTKYSILFPFLLVVMFSCKAENDTSTKPQPERPNILLINIDDLGWKDVTFNGSPFYETPNIDALAAQAMIFTNGYAAAANCAPSRASLMTGQWPQRHGIYTVGSSERGKSKDRILVPVKNTTTIPESFELLPQILKENGYTTCHAGKWHLSDDPLTKGFDVNIGGSHAGHPMGYTFPVGNVAIHAEPGKRLTDVVTNKAIDFIQNAQKPFFLNYATYAVHTPIEAVDDLLGKYEQKKKTAGMSNVEYATMVENMDWNVGRLITALKDSGKLKNTFIIFTSDNGGLFRVSQQHPLRAGKGSYYEGGIRVPFLFLWDGKIKNGKTDTPITNLDILPTILDFGQIKKPQNLRLDGISLYNKLMNNAQIEERSLFWHFPIYLEAQPVPTESRDPKFRTRPGSVIRKGDWKLHYYYENDEMELYNLKKDISEKNNLATTKPEKARELYEELQQWLKKTNAPIPTSLNKNFKN